MAINHLDFCSGIGGWALAFRELGINTVAFCEIEKYPQKVLQKNFPGVPIFNDLKELTYEDIKERTGVDGIDILTCSYPCQPFSVAGRKKGTQDDRDLWPQMFRIIKDFRPTWILGENVANFVNMAFQRTKTDLESEGYQVLPFIVPACGVGAPHRRDRVWIVAHTEGNSGERKLRDIHQANESIAQPKKQHQKKTEQFRNAGKYAQRSSDEADAQSYGRQRQWAVEPDVARMAHGVPNRVDRLKSLGNAIVPQVAYEFLKNLKEITK